jgi:hypothetical protein
MLRLPVPVLATVVLAAAVWSAGCDRTTDGVATPNKAHVGQTVPSAQVDTVLLIPSQVTDIVGVELRPKVEQTVALPGIPDDGPCAGVDTVGMQAFVGDGYSSFHLVLSANGDDANRNHVVAQAASIYPDAASAEKAFAAATPPLAACNGKEVKAEADWRYAVTEVTADSVRWNKVQKDSPQLWVCYGQARVRDNVIVQAMACQGDDGGEHVANAVLDHMSATVWELAGR